MLGTHDLWFDRSVGSIFVLPGIRLAFRCN
jgi:hypothetical protein